MSGNEDGGESFEDALRSIASELGRYIERSIDNVDVDELAGSFGVDANAAREWIESAGGWLSGHTENLGEELARRARSDRAARPDRPGPRVDPLGSARPHPLDVPTDEQGLALAALDSGRWIVEPGADVLAGKGDGPGPSDALGIVRELRARDWITTDGKLTLAGRHALSRWLDAAKSS
ncbi:MAG TPA: hypothetical protein VFH80_31305 [Solirubrobacteraceae bacterium]|nr:hypothetical protein [Solirubrobacteraceae bacterium]